MTTKRNPNDASNNPPNAAPPPIDDSIEAELGKRLREAFSDVYNDPLPDRFRQFIEALKEGGDR